jgi:hypothetical protein
VAVLTIFESKFWQPVRQHPFQKLHNLHVPKIRIVSNEGAVGFENALMNKFPKTLRAAGSIRGNTCIN